MHTDISVVPNSLFTSANFCPTSGSMAALEKWNSTVAAANTRAVFD
jgi:hypothetical protein